MEFSWQAHQMPGLHLGIGSLQLQTPILTGARTTVRRRHCMAMKAAAIRPRGANIQLMRTVAATTESE